MEKSTMSIHQQSQFCCRKQNLEQSESKNKNETSLNRINIPISNGNIEEGREPMA
jgi:hypothetical protein